MDRVLSRLPEKRRRSPRRLSGERVGGGDWGFRANSRSGGTGGGVFVLFLGLPPLFTSVLAFGVASRNLVGNALSLP